MATAGENAGSLAFRLRKCVDPRVDTDDLNSIDNEYIGYVGAQNWNRYSIPATSVSTSELKFTNIQSPGPNVLWDKKWWIEYLIQIKISNIPGSNNMTNPFLGSDPALMFRPYPLHQTTNTIQVRINNRDIQSFPRETLNARMEYWPQDKLKLSCGCCPHRKYNGQTMADCDIRAGNAPFGDMKEFTDQDYPNSTLINIEKIEVVQPKLSTGCRIEKDVPLKGYYLKSGAKLPKADGTAEGGVTKAEEVASYKYQYIRAQFVNHLKTTYPNGVTIADMPEVKKKFLEIAEVNTILKSTTIATGGNKYAAEFEKDKLLDADFLTAADVQALATKGIIETDDSGAPIVYYCGCSCESLGSYTIQARIREPVIAEPLDFTSSAEFGRTMWNINSVELRYTFSDNLRNMLVFDRYKLMRDTDWFWAYEIARKYLTNEKEREFTSLFSDSNFDVNFVEAPRLIYNIATPFVPPSCPFICAHKQFQRFESHLTADMDSANIKRQDFVNITSSTKKITATSEAYPLQFHPNAIYLWVGERSVNRYKAPNRYTHIDSYAKIVNVRISYGNASNILANFDDHELFQMSLRNGLKDRSYLDWNATPKSICVPTNYYGNEQVLGISGQIPVVSYDETDGIKYSTIQPTSLPAWNRYAGIGSVVKLIPGIDVLTGDSTNPLVAGMHAYSSTIKIEVDFIPLNVHEEIDYSLFVMFEYDGVCTINPQTCDLGMIAIDSWEQLKATPKARTLRESYAYGSGLGDKALQLGRKLRTIKKQLGIERAPARGSGINPHPNMAPKMSGGRIIDPRELSGTGRNDNFFTQY